MFFPWAFVNPLLELHRNCGVNRFSVFREIIDRPLTDDIAPRRSECFRLPMWGDLTDNVLVHNHTDQDSPFDLTALRSVFYRVLLHSAISLIRLSNSYPL